MSKLHIAKAVNSTPSYKYGRTITSTTKDCFVSNLPDLSQSLNISNSAEKLDDITETMDSLFSSTLDTVAPLRLRKIKEKSPVLRRLRKSPVAQHFAKSRHSVSTLQYIGIEVVKCPWRSGDINITFTT